MRETLKNNPRASLGLECEGFTSKAFTDNANCQKILDEIPALMEKKWGKERRKCRRLRGASNNDNKEELEQRQLVVDCDGSPVGIDPSVWLLYCGAGRRDLETTTSRTGDTKYGSSTKTLKYEKRKMNLRPFFYPTSLKVAFHCSNIKTTL